MEEPFFPAPWYKIVLNSENNAGTAPQRAIITYTT
jgi:hypothetical protein